MITLGGGATKIHLATEPIDLRRGYSGLYTLVEQQFGAEPQNGNLWVFTNRRRNLLKIFWWDEGGMVVLGKRLHEGTCKPPSGLGLCDRGLGLPCLSGSRRPGGRRGGWRIH